MAFTALFEKPALSCANVALKHAVKILLDVDDKLSVIEDKLTKIQECSYHTGLAFLRYASEPELDDNSRRAFLIDAAKEFTRSANQVGGRMIALS
jgi:hypothetical protein